MPYKHQAACFRTINGARYVNYCDILSDEHEECVVTAKVRQLRHRVIKHKDGFRQLFVHENDVDKMNDEE